MAGRLVLCFLFVIISMIKVTLQSLQEDIALRMNDTERTLSRKRRYLVFPEGSSLQLVYCLTIPSVGVGSIFTIGSTAALAWELPHDPFVPFRKPSEVLHRIDKPGKHSSGGWSIQNTNSPAPVSYKKTYYNNPFLINKPPVVGYSTINTLAKESSGLNRDFTPLNSRRQSGYYGSGRTNNKNYNRYQTVRNSKQPTYNSQYSSQKAYSQPVTTYMHPVYHKVYRRTRRDLYTKIEKLFTALSRDGKACLLKTVCEVSTATRERGTFMEEIIKVIFSVRHHTDKSNEEVDAYDLASSKQHNCTELYPTCEHSIWNGMFSFT